jgi:hydroxyacylglutathione hydrolase
MKLVRCFNVRNLLEHGHQFREVEELGKPGAGTIVTYCQSGVRNSVAASALRRAGYDIAELDGSYAAWVSRAGNVPVLEAA